jgi:hypothetical protein
MAVTNPHPDVQVFRPRWPDLVSLTPDRVRLTYDRPTDTLFVDFRGAAVPAASIPLDRGDRDYLFLRVDPATEEVVGLQIEHFLSYAILQHPELTDTLDAASLIGITRDEIDRIIPIRSGQRKPEEQTDVLESLMRLSA